MRKRIPVRKRLVACYATAADPRDVHVSCSLIVTVGSISVRGGTSSTCAGVTGEQRPILSAAADAGRGAAAGRGHRAPSVAAAGWVERQFAAAGSRCQPTITLFRHCGRALLYVLNTPVRGSNPSAGEGDLSGVACGCAGTSSSVQVSSPVGWFRCCVTRVVRRQLGLAVVIQASVDEVGEDQPPQAADDVGLREHPGMQGDDLIAHSIDLLLDLGEPREIDRLPTTGRGLETLIDEPRSSGEDCIDQGTHLCRHAASSVSTRGRIACSIYRAIEHDIKRPLRVCSGRLGRFGGDGGESNSPSREPSAPICYGRSQRLFSPAVLH